MLFRAFLVRMFITKLCHRAQNKENRQHRQRCLVVGTTDWSEWQDSSRHYDEKARRFRLFYMPRSSAALMCHRHIIHHRAIRILPYFLIEYKNNGHQMMTVVFMVGMTGFEPATSCSHTLKYRFFPYFTRLFGTFVSENGAFRCSSSHCFHVVRSRRWSKMWSNYNHPRFRAEEFIQCHSQINLINRKYYTINSLKSQDYISGEFVMQSILSTLKNWVAEGKEEGQ